eukprot:g14737.t1
MTGLELRMDSLWSIRDAEEVVDSTFSKLVTPQIRIAEEEREWVTKRQKKSKKAAQVSPAVISLQNRYTEERDMTDVEVRDRCLLTPGQVSIRRGEVLGILKGIQVDKSP